MILRCRICGWMTTAHSRFDARVKEIPCRRNCPQARTTTVVIKLGLVNSMRPHGGTGRRMGLKIPGRKVV